MARLAEVRAVEANIALLHAAAAGPAAAPPQSVSRAIPLAVLCERRRTQLRLPRPESRQELLPDARDVGGDAAEQSAAYRCGSAGAGMASSPDTPALMRSPASAQPVSCARAVPWPCTAQQSGPCEPLYSPILHRAAPERQREPVAAAGRPPDSPPDAATELNVTEPPRRFDNQATMQPQTQAVGGTAGSEQSRRGLLAGVHPSREHLFRSESPPLGNPRRHRRAAASDGALEAAQAAARRALTSGVKPPEPPCTRCQGAGHSRETCRCSDKTARRRRRKAKLAQKAAREVAAKAAAAAPAACAAATIADGVPPPEQQPTVKRKRKLKGV